MALGVPQWPRYGTRSVRKQCGFVARMESAFSRAGSATISHRTGLVVTLVEGRVVVVPVRRLDALFEQQSGISAATLVAAEGATRRFDGSLGAPGGVAAQDAYLLNHLADLVPQDTQEAQLQEGHHAKAEHAEQVGASLQPPEESVVARCTVGARRTVQARGVRPCGRAAGGGNLMPHPWVGHALLAKPSGGVVVLRSVHTAAALLGL